VADFVQVSSVMGFAIPRLLFHVAVTLYYIKTTMCWALHFVGLHDSGEPDNSSWRDFPDINSSSVPSISADTIRVTGSLSILQEKKKHINYYFLSCFDA
jgi:hypothetical protein